MPTTLLDSVPLWCFPPLILMVCLLTMEAGYRLGKWRHQRATDEKEGPVAAMTASALGLLAFMLGFTFSLAATRFDARREAVVQEANAIATTYLRSRLLPEPEGPEVAMLLKRYTEIRARPMSPHNVASLMSESEEIHEQLWSLGVAAAKKDANPIMTGLFLDSLNKTIDLHSERVFVGIYSRVPLTLWWMLSSLIMLGMISLGYQAGISATRRSLEMPIFALAFTCVLYLLVDLDRGHEGLVQVSQKPILSLNESMQSR